MSLELNKLIIWLFFEAGVFEIALMDNVLLNERLPAVEL